MKSFKEFMLDELEDVSSEELTEGIARKGAAAVYASNAKKYGDKADRLFQRGVSRVKSGDMASTEERIKNLERGLSDTMEGLSALRKQIGSNTAMMLVIALMSERSDDQIKRFISEIK